MGDLRTAAYQAYVVGLKRYWSTELYAVVASQAAHVAEQPPREIEQAMSTSHAYRAFAWLEVHLQQMKYYGRWGLVTLFAEADDQLAGELAEGQKREPDKLANDVERPLPDYYVDTDFHQHRGGIWSDPSDAFAYEAAARSTTPVASDHGDLHSRFADHVRAITPADGVVLDMGCGFGKTTEPIRRAMPGATVVGVDLSPQVLGLAHLRAVQQGLDIRYVQDRQEDLVHFEDESVDTIAASMLIHEVPTDVLVQSLREAYRVLKPGGRLVYLDFYEVPGGNVGRFLILGHSTRNNEPFIRSLLAMDFHAEMAAAGFTDVATTSFEEEPDALARGTELPEFWRFPWTLLAGTKPATESAGTTRTADISVAS
ncbi:class I SAM-dependent methyltransferase [Nocardioides bigeumensis]|uniref:class I SAM-dependent methyltransferase n=1 Tax=Nocardioides bigeumensis TaxID=433657 RepID=UPI0031CF2E5A